MKVVEFFKKPRNLYLSIVAMLIVVFGLSSVTFSYYVGETSDSNQMMQVKRIDTIIESKDLNDGTVELLPNETRLISINVKSNNDYPNEFKLYYTADGVTVTSNKEIVNTIDAKSTLTYELAITNETEEMNNVKIEIINGYIGSTLVVNGNEIKN